VSEQSYRVVDETVDDEYQEANAHGCANVEEGEPTPPEPATYPLKPAVESYGLKHEVVRLGYDSVFVGLQENSERVDDDPNSEVEK
jgi:hypothetical protein